jgi:hypothetical protein
VGEGSDVEIKKELLFLFIDQGFGRRPCYGNNS